MTAISAQTRSVICLSLAAFTWVGCNGSSTDANRISSSGESTNQGGGNSSSSYSSFGGLRGASTSRDGQGGASVVSSGSGTIAQGGASTPENESRGGNGSGGRVGAGGSNVIGPAVGGRLGGAGSATAAGSTGRLGNAGMSGRGTTVTPTAGGSGGTSPSTTLSSGSPATCSSSATLKAGDTKKTMSVGGQDRTYTVHAPSSYNGRAAVPVVFDFHGMGSNASQQKMLSGWDKLADKQGFIVVYPDGTGNSWNAGGCCPSASTDKIDDVGFVKAIITALATDACIDLKHIYASGCSNGGAMSYRLACDAADVVAAVAPVDFDTVANPCKPSRPITEIQFRATKDQMVDYKGAEPNFEKWGKLNQCTGTAAAMASNSSCEQYPSCAEGAETILCTVQDGTHCANYSSFQIPQVAWTVLQQHALP